MSIIFRKVSGSGRKEYSYESLKVIFGMFHVHEVFAGVEFNLPFNEWFKSCMLPKSILSNEDGGFVDKLAIKRNPPSPSEALKVFSFEDRLVKRGEFLVICIKKFLSNIVTKKNLFKIFADCTEDIYIINPFFDSAVSEVTPQSILERFVQSYTSFDFDSGLFFLYILLLKKSISVCGKSAATKTKIGGEATAPSVAIFKPYSDTALLPTPVQPPINTTRLPTPVQPTQMKSPKHEEDFFEFEFGESLNPNKPKPPVDSESESDSFLDEIEDSIEDGRPLKPFLWSRNSCFLDSVIYNLLYQPIPFVDEFLDKDVINSKHKFRKLSLEDTNRFRKAIHRELRDIRDRVRQVKDYSYEQLDISGLRKALSMLEPEFNSGSSQDASEVLGLLVSLFDHFSPVSVKTVFPSGKTRVLNNSIILDVPFDILKNSFERLEDALVNINFEDETSKVKDETRVLDAPFLIVKLDRLSRGRFSNKKIIIDETIIPENSNNGVLELYSIVSWCGSHYVSFVKRHGYWYFVNDMNSNVIEVGKDLEDIDKANRAIQSYDPRTNGTLFFYKKNRKGISLSQSSSSSLPPPAPAPVSPVVPLSEILSTPSFRAPPPSTPSPASSLPPFPESSFNFPTKEVLFGAPPRPTHQPTPSFKAPDLNKKSSVITITNPPVPPKKPIVETLPKIQETVKTVKTIKERESKAPSLASIRVVRNRKIEEMRVLIRMAKKELEREKARDPNSEKIKKIEDKLNDRERRIQWLESGGEDEIISQDITESSRKFYTSLREAHSKPRVKKGSVAIATPKTKSSSKYKPKPFHQQQQTHKPVLPDFVLEHIENGAKNEGVVISTRGMDSVYFGTQEAKIFKDGANSVTKEVRKSKTGEPFTVEMRNFGTHSDEYHENSKKRFFKRRIPRRDIPAHEHLDEEIRKEEESKVFKFEEKDFPSL